jgi:formate-dependent nitrite reductase membrane component NrfD
MPGVTTEMVRHSNGPAKRDLPTGGSSSPEPSYYDLSFLKPPVWKWEIASYFFLGGLSGGAYLISRMAERFGGREHADVARLGSFVALGALLPCPALLIHDLGDPARFHHMLRVWKPATPMNLGTWTLTAFSGAAGLSFLRQWAKHRSRHDRTLAGRVARAIRAMNMPIVAVTDGAGIPLAILLAGYTGVLISCTANPLWCKNPWLGPLFISSGVTAGAAAINLALTFTGHDVEGPAHQALEAIDTTATVAEIVSIGGFIRHAGKNAEPLTRGRYKRHLYLGVGAMVAAEVVKRLPVSGKTKTLASIAGAAIGIASAFSIKWAITYAGHDAAKNPKLARNLTRARTPAQEPRIVHETLSHQMKSGPDSSFRYATTT